VAVIGNMK